MIVCGCLFLWLAPTSAALASSPTAAPQTTQYKSWSPEPQGRGTYSIIFSCLATLLFCAIKILKTNILSPGWTGRMIHFIQILAGMFVPEVVYLMALGQFFGAKGLRDTVNRKAEAFAQQQIPRSRLSNAGHYRGCGNVFNSTRSLNLLKWYVI